MVPRLRITPCNGAAISTAGDYVLYWMIAARRPTWNFALERAAALALELDRRLLVFEPLRVGYRWASDRLHRFVIEGMADNRAWFGRRGVRYYPYIERKPGEGCGLLEALSERACVVVTDDYPCFFLPRMVDAAATRMAVRLEKVDSNGLLPLRATDRVFETAHSFRRFLQEKLGAELGRMPDPDPLRRYPPRRKAKVARKIAERWPPASATLLHAPDAVLRRLPIDHGVAAVKGSGGLASAQKRMRKFVRSGLASYHRLRNDPQVEGSSGLSPYLHFGHISAHEVFWAVAAAEGWKASDLGEPAGGKRRGSWGMGEGAETSLDQLVTWRELGFNMCANSALYDAYESLPRWARETLERHTRNPRPYLYELAELEGAKTHDELWNAAQRQLLQEGRMNNYLRMLWGKKILEWSRSPREALAAMIELNNGCALDGRDPNSYCGIFWVLGRYDRPRGPERPIFGTVRYMSSDSARRKLELEGYLAKYRAQ